ncbi:MAG: hypothetical protein DSZ32_05055 [Gammaproteobacteria bacterium]|nr:MAG: hypothetical protein DSZ32_05055 [Gammaproteobacteria bacterium]
MTREFDEKSEQIRAVHANFIHSVVHACHNRENLPPLQQALDQFAQQGWEPLVKAVRRIIQGERGDDLLNGLDDEDAVILQSILMGLQNPETLPDPDQKPDGSHAAPGLAQMIFAAGRGDAAALQGLAVMAEQMTQAGGEMALLGGRMRDLINGERSSSKLTRGMGAQGKSLVYSILEELGKLSG